MEIGFHFNNVPCGYLDVVGDKSMSNYENLLKSAELQTKLLQYPQRKARFLLVHYLREKKGNINDVRRENRG